MGISAEKELPGSEGYEAFLADIKTISAECAKYGIKLLYHNHDFEFEKIDGKNKLDILYADTTPNVLQTQIDTCWAKVGGEDPAKYVVKYTGRAPLVHLKDFVGSKSANMYALIDGGEVEEKDNAVVPFELRPVGYGIQDVLSIIKAAEYAEKFGVDDFAAGFVRLEGGIILDFMISWAMHMDTIGDAIILGTKGGLRIPSTECWNGEFDKPLTIYKDVAGKRVQYQIPHGPSTNNGKGLFFNKIRSFIAAVKYGGEPTVPSSQIIYNQAIIDGIIKSNAIGKEIEIEIPEI